MADITKVIKFLVVGDVSKAQSGFKGLSKELKDTAKSGSGLKGLGRDLRDAVKSGQGTGKTAGSCVLALWLLLRRYAAMGVLSAPTMKQCTDVWLTEMRRILAKADAGVTYAGPTGPTGVTGAGGATGPSGAVGFTGPAGP